MSEHLLDVDDLYVEFRTRDGVAEAINGVSYTLDAGETLAVLGESGSGKSVTAQTIMGILDMPPGFITGGRILYNGKDLLTMPESERQKIRGAEIAMIFQDSLSALNPPMPGPWPARGSTTITGAASLRTWCSSASVPQRVTRSRR